MTAMELAAKMRTGEAEFSPYLLWAAAREEGVSYSEAMIHAGAVGPKDQGRGPFKPFDVCPDCGAELGPSVSHMPELEKMSAEERKQAAERLRAMADGLERGDV